MKQQRKERRARFGNALTEAVHASELAQAEIVRRAIAHGAGSISDTNLAAYMKGTHAPTDPETVWALEKVLGRDGQLSRPLGLLPASEGLSSAKEEPAKDEEDTSAPPSPRTAPRARSPRPRPTPNT